MTKSLSDLSSQKNVDEIVLTALKVQEFRAQLKKDPEQALKDAGIEYTRAEIDALKKLDWASIENVFKAFSDPRINFT